MIILFCRHFILFAFLVYHFLNRKRLFGKVFNEYGYLAFFYDKSSKH